MLSYTFRITPKSKTLKTKKQILTLLANKQTKIKKLLLMKEGGGSAGALAHYHGIITTKYKRQSIRNFIKNELTLDQLVKAEYALKDKAIEHQDKPEHAYNYVCKEGQVYFSLGFPIEDIKKFQHRFKKDEEEFKIKKMDKLQACITRCAKLPENSQWEMSAIRIVLEEYHKRKLMPPVGYQLQRIIGRIMMEINIDVYISAVQGNYRELGFFTNKNDLDKVSHYEYYCHSCGYYHDPLESCITIIK